MQFLAVVVYIHQPPTNNWAPAAKPRPPSLNFCDVVMKAKTVTFSSHVAMDG